MKVIGKEAAGGLQNKFNYNGKEEQSKEFSDGSGLDYLDYGARMYDAQIGRWNVIDPHSINYVSYSPFVYVGNMPMLLVDPDGRDWFYHSKDGKANATWQWHEGNSYNTGVKDEDGNEVILQGEKVVVVFEGSRNEKLGTKKDKQANEKYGYIDGEGAKTASITVYGPKGGVDIHKFTGYTMGSDASKFGAIDEGIYNANYDTKGKSGALTSHWTLNARGHVRMLDGKINPNAPDQVEKNGEGYKDGIFIHTSNQSGYAGSIHGGKSGISVGCLLVTPKDWPSFNQILVGVSQFKVQLIRDGKTGGLK
jgi:RHS repeat-associated protein